ncbi:SusC/RagA family TonB-linked outer membrane protein [Pedobacter sp. MC2016-14]|uniref:SusC/RagA family TonB-linked outer membrane protein n=1 Tax=Pedobacter sp. MC2016-14 TaxID=2897327 RepID=UPI001E41AD15|nr:SusC/RagA family TonB-linked outer membrane protein [Pedobacter sp. MC2016-14]MCD0488065.1 SusC/RagA family TonB-linked outer membrane protein [Pedobacter sp. MC2016-14]
MIFNNPERISRFYNTISRRLLLICLVSVFSLNTSGQVKKQILFDQEPISTAFTKLEKEFNSRFYYSSGVIDKKEKVSMPAKQRTLNEILAYLSDNYGFLFKASGNMIAVSKKAVPLPSGNIPTKNLKEVKGRAGLAEISHIVYVAGITIREQGTSNSAITDNQGNFRINTTSVAPKLLISYIGYQSSEIEVSGNAVVSVNLIEDANTLDEVTVVSNGYQTLAKKNATGSYATISSADIERRSSQTLDRILEGSIPGLSVYNGFRSVSGTRTQVGSDIQVRGGSAIQSERNTPLIIVDGFPVNQLPDNFNDVEKIDVLKDAAASAIWGARAANGVIVITTKRGKQGDLKIDFSTNLYFTQKNDFGALRKASSADMISVDNEIFKKGYFNSSFFQTGTSGFSPSFDYIMQNEQGLITNNVLKQRQDSLSGLSNLQQNKDLLMRIGVRQNYYLSLAGGAVKYRFVFSGSYDNSKSNFIGDESSNIQVNMRNDYEITRWLHMVGDINAVFNNQNIGTDLRSQLYGLAPYQMQVDAAGNYVYSYNSFNRNTNSTLMAKGYYDNGMNLLQDARLADNESSTFGLRAKLGLEATLAKGLTFNTYFLYDKMKISNHKLLNENSYTARSLLNQYASLDANGKAFFNLPKGNYLDIAETTNDNTSLRSQFNYSNLFGSKHFLNFSAGAEVKQYLTNGLTNRKFNYIDDLQSWSPINQVVLLNGVIGQSGSSRIYDVAQYDQFSYKNTREVSSYATGTYTYDDKYTLQASLRFDESNLFGVDPKYRRTPLWSLGASWDITKEKFFQVDFINLLKLRATVGLTGNYDPSTTPLLVATRAFQTATSDYRARISTDNPYNPMLRWERTKTYNMGTDIAFLSNRFQLSVDLYKKHGYDLLGTQLLDPTIGFTSTKVNGARMINTGLETAFTGMVLKGGGFSWTSTLNFAYNTNKITENRIAESNPVTGRVTGTVPYYVAGNQRESLWSYQWAGLSSQGDPQVYDGNGNKVLVPVLGSLINSGSYRPKYTGGFTNIFNYKGAFASAILIYNFGGVFRREMPTMNGYNWSPVINYQVANRWKAAGDEANTDIPAFQSSPTLSYDGRDRAAMYSSNSVESSNFVRLREVQLGYKIPGSVLEKTPVKSLSLSMQMNNVALWTKNKYGIDPEAIDPQTGAYYLPAPKITTISLRAGF